MFRHRSESQDEKMEKDEEKSMDENDNRDTSHVATTTGSLFEAMRPSCARHQQGYRKARRLWEDELRRKLATQAKRVVKCLFR